MRLMQDARPSSAGSPQMLGSGLTREASAASSELSAVTEAEAEIRRLTEVCCSSQAYASTACLHARKLDPHLHLTGICSYAAGALLFGKHRLAQGLCNLTQHFQL